MKYYYCSVCRRRTYNENRLCDNHTQKVEEYEHCEVRDIEHLEELIKSGCSFVTLTKGNLTSDGMDGAYLSNTKNYLSYQQPYWGNVKPQTEQMIAEAREYITTKG